MSQEAINGFRDLFILNPEIQNRLRLKVGTGSPVDVCLDALVNEGADNGLVFTRTELKAAIVNYAKTLDGETPACEAMSPPKLSHMREGIPAKPAQGTLPAKPAKPPIIPVSAGTSDEACVQLIVDATLEFLNSEYTDEGPGICNW